MCLIFFAIQNHPTYKLIVAGNRDEFYNRKTAPADFWQDYPDTLGGRDLEAKGTWMAITKQGRISFITNYRDPKNINPKAPSRGKLVLDYLQGDASAGAYLREVENTAGVYNGFNLIAGNANELWYLSNYKKGVEKIAPGFYGLSNHLLETPWPKVTYGKAKLEPLLTQSIILPEQLLDKLYDGTVAADGTLPDTGIGLARERALSSMFIKTAGYGSRCSTALLVDYHNEVVFAERTYDLQTFNYTTRTFQFKIEQHG